MWFYQCWVTFFWNNHVWRYFCLYFQGFCECFHRFCPGFYRLCPDYHQIKTFWGALAPPAPPLSTPVDSVHILQHPTKPQAEILRRKNVTVIKNLKSWQKLVKNLKKFLSNGVLKFVIDNSFGVKFGKLLFVKFSKNLFFAPKFFPPNKVKWHFMTSVVPCCTCKKFKPISWRYRKLLKIASGR